MKCYFISDLHVDFYSPMTRSREPLQKAFEQFYERNFLPADACCIAIPSVIRMKIPIRNMD